MNTRVLGLLAAVVLIAAAVTTIDTQFLTWRPGWAVRLGLAGVGVALALVQLRTGRREPPPT